MDHIKGHTITFGHSALSGQRKWKGQWMSFSHGEMFSHC